MKHQAVLGALALLACMWTSVASAAVPVKDAAILDRKSDTASSVVRLSPIQEQSLDRRRGVHCSVTTGRRASVENPIRQGDAAGATRSLSGMTGGGPVREGSSEAAFNADTMRYEETGSIMASVEGGQQAVSAARGTYDTMKGDVGSTQTVMEAFDQNSEIRTQNGMGFNSAINTLNELVKAMNLINKTTVTDQSRAAGGLGGQTDLDDGTAGRGGRCPAGMTGQGTTVSPCVRAGSSCTPSRTMIDPTSGCVVRRYRDSYGNVLVFLANVVEGTPPSGSVLTAEELQAMMNQYTR